MSNFLILMGIWFVLPLVLLTIVLLVHRKRNPLPEKTPHTLEYHLEIYGTDVAHALCFCGEKAYGPKTMVAEFVEKHRLMDVVPVGN